jgi:hypothetical protein
MYEECETIEDAYKMFDDLATGENFVWIHKRESNENWPADSSTAIRRYTPDRNKASRK